MNNLHFEEVMPGNLERECIEETCDSQGWDFNEITRVSSDVGNPILGYSHVEPLIKFGCQFIDKNPI